jgi:hypothetical protein
MKISTNRRAAGSVTNEGVYCKYGSTFPALMPSALEAMTSWCLVGVGFVLCQAIFIELFRVERNDLGLKLYL